jgi:hypothetical protein
MVFVGVVDNLRKPILNQRRDREANESEENPELEHYNIIIIIFWRMYFFILPIVMSGSTFLTKSLISS